VLVKCRGRRAIVDNVGEARRQQVRRRWRSARKPYRKADIARAMRAALAVGGA
jgi:hypothetical protein